MDFKGIEFHDIKKDFSGKPALSGIDLRIQRGTVHSVVGENGAGKSTLMNILNGVFPPSGGYVTLDGEKLALTNPLDALRCGIGMVYQHFMLVDELRVWQNIALGMEETGPLRILDEKKMKARIEAACKEYNFDFDLDSVTGDLPVGERQRIEIFKVLYRKAEYIILDEPTAVLVPEEVERLFESIEAFRRAGKTVIFISHKIEEVLRISDRISVLRRGEHVGTLDRRDATAEKLVNMMVGREIHIDGDPLPTEKGNVVFEMEGVSTAQKGFGCALHDVRFSVRQGEVLGFAGVDGNGQSELVQVLMHLMPISSGAMRFNGQDVTKLVSCAKRDFPASRRIATSRVWCWTPACTATWCRALRIKAASGAWVFFHPARSLTGRSSSPRSTTSAWTPSIRTPAASPAATSKRSSSPASVGWPIRSWSLRQTPPAVWTWAPLSLCIRPWSA